MYIKLATRSVRRSLRDFAIYFVTLAFGACVFYAFNSIADQQAVLELSSRQLEVIYLLRNMISGVTVFLALIFGFLVLYANRFLIRRRKHEFAIYQTLGMSRSKISFIIVLETLIVGIGALAIGLILGYLLSQLLVIATAALFNVRVEGFALYFSGSAAAVTITCFALIFICTLAFNVITVTRYKLLDLINASRVSEKLKLRNLPLAIILFIVSVGMIIASYMLLIDNGMLNMSWQFMAATILVCIGTFLFFFSLSGFLLRLVQSSKKIYLRGLNMFTLRQLSSCVNSAFVSIALVCLTLFVAFTSMCTGFATVTTLNKNFEKNTIYDASYSAYYNVGSDGLGDNPNGISDMMLKQASADNFNMEQAFAKRVQDWNKLVSQAAQIDFYLSNHTLGDLMKAMDYSFNNVYESVNPDGLIKEPLYVVKLSQFNNLRAICGEKAIMLASNECAIWCDDDDFTAFYSTWFVEKNELAIFNNNLGLAKDSPNSYTTLASTGSAGSNVGIIVVPDHVISEQLYPIRSILNIKYNGSRTDIDAHFEAAVAKTFGNAWINANINNSNGGNYGWPYLSGSSAQQFYDMSTIVTATVTYLAIYIGFIMLITCAAILALQQLTQASDSASRYVLLSKIGTSERMVSGALFWQTAVYFVFPLVLALAHTTIAMSVISDVVKLFGSLEIALPLLITTAIAVLVYGTYFIFTYLASRNFARN
ncbi:MAG: FtsX-like permease family protein [Coriobacteriales bacterium]|jgi:putative ABC transport system permease protein|nr:FtsX-like permease family protein [Coriobacteriales bacterium]